VLILLISITMVNAQGFMGIKPLNDTIPDEKNGFFFLPLLYYTPDTRLAYGGAGVYYFKIPPKHEYQQPTRGSYVQFLADYTQNKQLDVWGIWNIFTRNEDYILKGEARFRNFPDRFYGIGNDTKIADEEFYEYNLFSIKALALKKIRPSLFVGIDYNYETEYGLKTEAGGQLATGEITGFAGGIGSALGLVALFDSRDNIINPYKGRFAEVSSYFYSQSLGGTFNFTNINATYQQYWQVKPKHIFATQTVFRFNYGDVPFLDMATLGNDDILRGYPKNRFRDKHFWATQAEYRFPLFWRFGMVAFAGVGDVYDSVSDLRVSQLKYSIGTGLRFVVNPAERLNVRLDYGYGREGGNIYFIVTEAF